MMMKVTPPPRDTFLLRLAASQCDVRRSKLLSESRLSSSDDIITLQPEGEEPRQHTQSQRRVRAERHGTGAPPAPPL
ncbi:hypothetical protein EYF80_064573 [Liparis tanakae]|uniref:Uncharacterized protein n=1 Tax=Liparis tanakae TaxID=230148 RepID=A0A4Z2E930_9TELE|nr:hypothetical protein EYF80_064573 [Liparis tanakae]